MLLALRSQQYHELDSPLEYEIVLDALRWSINDVASDASVDEIAAYSQSFRPEQLERVARNVKGTAHEIAFAQAENADGDSVTAELFPDTYHPGADVLLTDSATGVEHAVQLKATASTSYAAAAVEAHPDIPVLATEEAVDVARGIASSGFSNVALEQDVSDTFDVLDGGFDLPVAGVAGAVGITALIRGGLLAARAYRGEEISSAEVREAGVEPAKAAGRAAILVGLGATPLAPAVGAYIAARMGLAALSMLSASDRRPAPRISEAGQPLIARKPTGHPC